MTNESQEKYRVLSLVLAALAVVAGILYLAGRNMTEPDRGVFQEPVSCTMEAKSCPDGSYVGRTGPDCEFSPCPTGGNPAVDTGADAGLTEEPTADLAEQIRACLPLSNWEAKLTCDRLIASIQSFAECQAAGFLVQESYPARCITPDGRSFTQAEVTITPPVKTNSTWEEIRQAILDCQVIAIMQSHSLEVRVTLNDGRQLTAIEPEIDAIIELAMSARPSCSGPLTIGTE